jgi:hypothetical protein
VQLTEYIPFETIREDYNEYQLENGIILRIKQMLASVLMHTEPEPYGKKSFSADFRDVSVILTPEGLDTSRLESVYPDEVTERDETEEMRFTTIREIINIYETKNSLFIIAPHITKIALTNKKDKKTNLPIIRYASDTMVSTVSKPNFSKIPEDRIHQM